MFKPSQSSSNLQLSAKNVARAASTTFNKMTGYKNPKKTDYYWSTIVSKTVSPPPNSSLSEDRGYSWPTKLVATCLCFFGGILLLNFIFTQNVGSDSKKSSQSMPSILREIEREENKIRMKSMNRDEGFAALLDNLKSSPSTNSNHGDSIKDDVPHSDEMDELFDKIENIENQNNIQNPVDSSSHSVDRDPRLEEESLKSLRSDSDLQSGRGEAVHSRIRNNPEQSSNAHSNSNSMNQHNKHNHQNQQIHQYHPYPLGLSDPDSGLYFVAMIADNDQFSNIGTYKWRSYLQHAKLMVSLKSQHDHQHQNSNQNEYDDYDVRLEWIPPPFESGNGEMDQSPIMISGAFSEQGRGMELSELVVFNGKLLAMDDRTGIIYEISKEFEAIPRHIVMKGDGNTPKGMKLEWATYKRDEDVLYMGSIGREYTDSTGDQIRDCCSLQWIITMDRQGILQREEWMDHYTKLRAATGTLFPGYLWIEAVEWSSVHQKWFIAPRYVSFEKYDSKLTEHRGANLLIIASEDFEEIELVWIRFETRNVIQRMDRDRNINDYDVKNRRDGARRIQDDVEYERKEGIDRDYGRIDEGRDRGNVERGESVESREREKKKDQQYQQYSQYHGITKMEDLNMEQKRAMSLKQENMRTYLKPSDLGFSTIKFLEGTGDRLLVAIRTRESDSRNMESVLTVFDVEGNVFLNQKAPLNNKYEGIAVL